MREEYERFRRALYGLPPDMQEIAYNQLKRRNLDGTAIYRFPMVTSLRFDALTSGDVTPTFRFPSLCVVFGISRRVFNFNAADDISDLDLVVTDSTSTRTILGTNDVRASLAGIPDPSEGSDPYLRLSPVSATSKTPWDVIVGVRSGFTLTNPVRGTLTVYGAAFWEGGEQIV